jgi:cytochrome P450
VRVISAILGCPWEDDDFAETCKALQDRKQDFINLTLVGVSEEDTRLALEATDEMDALMMPYVEAAREREPKPDDILALLWAEGPTIRPDWNVEDMLAWITTTYFAGTDTTTHAIQNAFYLLMTVDGLQDTLRAGGDEIIERYAEEVLRLYPSVHFTHRLANEDFELGGASIRADDALFVLDACGNRDPQRYACPAEIDLERDKTKDHLAFSLGPRTCAGSALARAEIQESVSRVLTRLPNLRLDPEAPHPSLQGFLLRSFAPLHVLFDAE